MIFYESHRSNKTKYLYHEFKENYSYGSHLHKSFEFALCFEGQLKITVGSSTSVLGPNQAVLVLPNQIHSYQTMTDRHFMCIFSCDYVSDFYKEIQGKTFEDPFFTVPGKDFVRGFQSAKSTFEIESLLYHICALAYENCKMVELNSSHTDLVERIIYYIQENYHDDINLKSMAQELGYSYNYLSSFINQTFGTNFSYLLNMYRIEYAASLLLEHRQSIADVASSCGFGSIRNFNRIFSQFYQMTPTEYINSSQQEISTLQTLLLPPWGYEDRLMQSGLIHKEEKK